MMSKFNVGDKVIIPKLRGVNRWFNLTYLKAQNAIVNNPVTVKSVLEDFVDGGGVPCLELKENSGKLFPEELFEHFIEPKYKVGARFTRECIGTKYRSQIVKSVLNKKRAEYYYVCFDLDDGYPHIYSESDLKKMIVEKHKIVSMTKEEIETALGKKIKIVNKK